MRRLAAGLLIAAAAAAAGCSADDDPAPVTWTVEQAMSITEVRSLSARVRECEGLGRPVDADDGARYPRFGCFAGIRAYPYDFESIAVFFVLAPLEEYDGPASRHRLTSVRFVGGPGIP